MLYVVCCQCFWFSQLTFSHRWLFFMVLFLSNWQIAQKGIGGSLGLAFFVFLKNVKHTNIVSLCHWVIEIIDGSFVFLVKFMLLVLLLAFFVSISTCNRGLFRGNTSSTRDLVLLLWACFIYFPTCTTSYSRQANSLV